MRRRLWGIFLEKSVLGHAMRGVTVEGFVLVPSVF